MPAPSTRPGRDRGRGLPPLALWSWLAAALIIVGLAVAVVDYFSGHRGASAGGMGGMDMGAAGALTRAGGRPFGPLLGSALLTRWQLNALALAVIVVLAAWYVGAIALRASRSPGAPWPVGRIVSYFAGLAVLGYATNGAIAVYDEALFSAHMLGHLALVMLGPALLLAGRPLRLAVESGVGQRREWLERLLRSRVVSFLTAPPVALASYTVVIVGSHLTGIMNTIMRNSWAGELEHLVYVLVGLQFFVLVVGDEPIRWRLSSPVRWLLLAVAMAVDTFTGIVLMQGTRAVAMMPPPSLHVDALSDTHTGGAVMWFGGDALMAVVMIALVIGWLRRVGTEHADEAGWLEQARRAAFTEHTGDADTDADGFDEDEHTRTSYNEWLQRLDGR